MQHLLLVKFQPSKLRVFYLFQTLDIIKFCSKIPCLNCVPAYGFKNHLSLTPDYNLFSKTVEDAKLSGNLDSPEGGFDAIMQAIVCKKEIGWRPLARHIIIFSSDAEFHIAGEKIIDLDFSLVCIQVSCTLI